MESAGPPTSDAICPDCDGAGYVELPTIRNDHDYTVTGTRREMCIACLGFGVLNKAPLTEAA
jgi:hypothetical protein